MKVPKSWCAAAHPAHPIPPPMRGGVRTGATGAIAPVDFVDFHNLLSNNQVLKLGLDLT